MPSTKLKPLYLAKSLKELNNKAYVELTNKSPSMKCNSARKLYAEAEKSIIDGDEERAYVLFMKYYELVKNIFGSADYKKDKKYYDDMIGMKNVREAIKQAEILSSSLERRYDIIKEEEKQKLEEETHEKATLSITEAKKEVKSDKAMETTNMSDCNGEQFKDCITSKQLYNLIKEGRKNLLIIDVRPEQHFNDSHIKHHSCFNIPEKILVPGVTGLTLENKLTEDKLQFWNRRENVDYIIMYNWFSDNTSNTLNLLKRAMHEWDSRVKLKNMPLILEGGFESWHLHYPMVTTNAEVNVPPHLISDSSDASLDFDYPCLDDDIDGALSMSLKHILSSNPVPSFDRSAKPRPAARISVYKTSNVKEENEDVPLVTFNQTKLAETNGIRAAIPQVNRSLKPKENEILAEIESPSVSSKQLEENLNKQDKLANESLDIEKERLEKEQQYNTLMLQREKQAEENMRIELQKKEEELIEKLKLLEIEKRKKEEEQEQLIKENQNIKLKLENMTKQREEDSKKFEEERILIERKYQEKILLERKTERYTKTLAILLCTDTGPIIRQAWDQEWPGFLDFLVF